MGLSGNKKLNEIAAITINGAKREFEQYAKPVKRYHSFMYKAESWDTPQKVIVKIEVTHMGMNVRYIVINLISFCSEAFFCFEKLVLKWDFRLIFLYLYDSRAKVL